MPSKKKAMHDRWFLNHPFYMLANGEEIRKAARKAGVRLVDAMYKTEFDVEAQGKPAEVLLDRYEKQSGSSDSSQTAPYYPEGQEPLVKMAQQRLTEIHAASVAEAQAKGEDEASKAQAALEDAARANAEASEGKAADAAKSAATKAAADAAAKAAAAKAEAEANKTIEAKAEIAEKAAK